MHTDRPAPVVVVGRYLFGGLIFGLFILGSHPASANLFAPPWDKLAHVLVFATLVIAMSAAWPKLSFPAIFLIAGLIGISDEIHQSFVPDRNPGWDDALADFAGIGLGLLLWQQRPGPR